MEGDYIIADLIPVNIKGSDVHAKILNNPDNECLVDEKRRYVRLPWNYQRQRKIGIYIGTSDIADLVVPRDEPGVAPIHGLITFNSRRQLVYFDCTINSWNLGTRVTFDNKGDETRNYFTWILSGTDYIENTRPHKPRIVIHITPTLQYTVDIPPQTINYKAHVDRFFHDSSLLSARNATISDYLTMRVLHLIDHPDAHPQPRQPVYVRKRIGNGAFGNVDRLYNVSTGVYIARKTPITSTLDTVHMHLWARELQMQTLIKERGSQVHGVYLRKCIVKFLDGALQPSPYIDLEFVSGGTLSEEHARSPLNEKEIANVLLEALSGLAFLHDPAFDCIAHRDMKPDNILVEYRDASRSPVIQVKLADFGLSKNQELGTVGIGTKRYMAAEVASPVYGEQYTTAVDIWALGVVTYELLHGYPASPYTTDHRSMCRQIVRTVAAKAREGDHMARFLGHCMIRMAPAERFTARQCISAALHQDSGRLYNRHDEGIDEEEEEEEDTETRMQESGFGGSSVTIAATATQVPQPSQHLGYAAAHQPQGSMHPSNAGGGPMAVDAGYAAIDQFQHMADDAEYASVSQSQNWAVQASGYSGANPTQEQIDAFQAWFQQEINTPAFLAI